MNFKKYHVSKNLYNVNSDVSGAIIGQHGATSYGNLVVSSVTISSDYINVSPNTVYTFSCKNMNPANPNGRGYAFYDSDRRVIPSNTDTTYEIAQNVVLNTTTPSTAAYIRLSHDANATDIMLNSGNTALPYEAYGNTWTDIPHYIHNTSTDTITTLPADIYANDTTATVGLKGQAVQSSTPSPASPVMPQGCGDKTANLLSEKYENRSINGVGAFTIDNNYDLWLGEVVEGQTYTISNMDYVFGFFTSKPLPNTGATYDGSRGYEISGTAVVTVPPGCTWIAVRVLQNADNAMLNTGETALPYEPFGVKIPISSADTTTNNYLGEVETTRKIKKLVLTGEELFTINASGNNTYFAHNLINPAIRTQAELCTHLTYVTITSSNTDVGFSIIANGAELRIRIPNAASTSLADFKAYLQQQYANGTPVTVWYVLSSATTGIVNEPLMRIGDYADTLSNISIPVTAGANTLSVGTTVQPSEVTVNYKGWHPVADVHEFTGNYTVGTMQTLPISELETHTISDLQGGEWS